MGDSGWGFGGLIVGEVIAASVFDVDPGDTEFPQLRGQVVWVKAEAGFDVDGDRDR